jgi:hypothetical protein
MRGAERMGSQERSYRPTPMSNVEHGMSNVEVFRVTCPSTLDIPCSTLDIDIGRFALVVPPAERMGSEDFLASQPVSRSCGSEYRAPCTAILEAALLISRRSTGNAN